MSDWKNHFYRVGPSTFESADKPADDIEVHRRKIEPWLSAVFQSEHLSLLLGSGFSIGIAGACGAKSAGMDPVKFACELADKVDAFAKSSAKKCGRGKPNIEDQIRAATQLL